MACAEGGDFGEGGAELLHRLREDGWNGGDPAHARAVDDLGDGGLPGEEVVHDVPRVGLTLTVVHVPAQDAFLLANAAGEGNHHHVFGHAPSARGKEPARGEDDRSGSGSRGRESRLLQEGSSLHQ